MENKLSNQMVGNIGLYYTCYELSRRGWNVLPTSRNARGIDVIAYNHSATRTLTVQVKTLTKKNPVPFGTNLNNLIAEYIVICRKVLDEKPEIFIAKTVEIKPRIKNVQGGYWLEPKDYEVFKDKWGKIGKG